MFKRLLILVALLLLASPVSANADEFIEWTGEAWYNGNRVYVGVNKYSGDVIYMSNAHSLQVIQRK